MKFTNATLKYFLDNKMYYFLYKNKRDIINATRVDINWDFISMIISDANMIDLLKENLNWKLVSGAATLDVATIEQFYSELDKSIISRHQVLSRQFIKDHGVDLNWTHLLEFQDICDENDMSVVDMYPTYIDKNTLIEFNQVDMDYLEDNYADLDNEIISRFQVVTTTFINDHAGDLNFISLVVGGSINNQVDFITYQPMTEINMSIEFIDFDIAFIDTNYSNINKNRIWRYQKTYSDQFLEDHEEDINFNLLSKYADLTESQLVTYILELDKTLISKYQTLSESFIDDNLTVLNSKLLSKHQVIGENLILKYPSRFDLNNISIYQTLSDTSLRSTIGHRLPFNVISANQTLTETQAEYFKVRLALNKVLKKSGLSYSFVSANIKLFDSYDVCRYCVLTEGNIETLNSSNLINVDWNAISKYQTLSETYINIRKEKLNIDLVLINQVLGAGFKESLITWYLDN